MNGNLLVGSINDAGINDSNLIINPEFTINQRGAASRTATTGYNFDRWYYDGSRLLQGVESVDLRASTYVITWEGSATCEYSLNTASSASQSGQSYTSIAKGGTIIISSVGSNNLWVRFSSNLTTLTKVSIKQGTADSVFIARKHPLELMMCQRYYYEGVSCFSVGQTSTGVYGVVSLPVEMRSTPTVNKTTGSFKFGDMVSAGYTSTSTPALADVTLTNLNKVYEFSLAGFSGLTSYRSYKHEPNTTQTSLITMSAEL